MSEGRFAILDSARRALVLCRMGADVAVHLCPDDPEIQREQGGAHAALREWEEEHAREWNQIKPWYEGRLPRNTALDDSDPREEAQK